MRGRKRLTRRWVVAGAAALASTGSFATYGAGTAAAGSYTYCGYGVQGHAYCPQNFGSSHPRHTYYNNESRWGYDRKSGCDIVVFSAMHWAYENSTGDRKYYAEGCNWLVDWFTGNTQLLRPYVGHYNTNFNNLMVGDADW